MTVLGQRYVVQQGDSLWRISERHLGDPLKWRSIYEHNNRNEVIVATKTKIKDPDLIFVGQEIYIPINKSSNPGGNKRVPPGAKFYPTINTGRKSAYNRVKGIPFKFKLEDLPLKKVESPTFIAIIKLSGGVTIQTKEIFDFVTISQEGFEASAKNEAMSVRDQLVESKVGFKNTTNEIAFECNMTVKANYKHAPVVGTSVGVSSYNGMPALKGSIKFPPLKGEISNYFFVSQDISVEIEVIPKPNIQKPQPVPTAKEFPQQVVNRSPSGWDYIDGITIAFGVAVVVGATIGEDIITFGAGIWNDIPSFAAAAAMLTISIRKFKGEPEEPQKKN